MSALRHGFNGNKFTLPTMPCVHCGRPMSWRKAWSRSWDQVKYCSDACRDGKVPAQCVRGPVR